MIIGSPGYHGDRLPFPEVGTPVRHPRTELISTIRIRNLIQVQPSEPAGRAGKRRKSLDIGMPLNLQTGYRSVSTNQKEIPMPKTTAIALTLIAVATTASAADDQATCRQMVDSWLDAERMLSPASSMVDNSKRRTPEIMQLRGQGAPECDIQRRVSGTAAQLPKRDAVTGPRQH